MDFGLLLLRLVVGLTFAGHGAQKIFGWFGGYGPSGTGQWLESMGFRPGRRYALAVGYAELLGGLLFAAGLLTPLAAALIVAVMVVAVATVHWKNGFWNTAGGYEYNLVLVAAVLSVVLAGPGAFSVDRVAGLELHGWTWALGAALVGLAGALGQLGQRQQESAPATGGHVEGKMAGA